MSAIVGPHGSAFLNILWTAPNALLVEIMSEAMTGNVVFWEVRLPSPGML